MHSFFTPKNNSMDVFLQTQQTQCHIDHVNHLMLIRDEGDIHFHIGCCIQMFLHLNYILNAINYGIIRITLCFMFKEISH